MTAPSAEDVLREVGRLTHADLVKIAARWLSRQGCGVVLTETLGGPGQSCIPDAIGWKSRGYSIMVECKASIEDFRRDRDKPWKRGQHPIPARASFYLTPKGLLTDCEIPPPFGLLEFDGKRVRETKPSARIPVDFEQYEGEIVRLVAELRRYQAQGIVYRKLGDAAEAQAVLAADAAKET